MEILSLSQHYHNALVFSGLLEAGKAFSLKNGPVALRAWLMEHYGVESITQVPQESLPAAAEALHAAAIAD